MIEAQSKGRRSWGEASLAQGWERDQHKGAKAECRGRGGGRGASVRLGRVLVLTLVCLSRLFPSCPCTSVPASLQGRLHHGL